MVDGLGCSRGPMHAAESWTPAPVKPEPSGGMAELTWNLLGPPMPG